MPLSCQLTSYQPPKQPLLCHQLIKPSLLHNPPLRHHINNIRVPNSTQTMSNNNPGHIQPLQTLSHDRLSFIIQSTSRLIQQNNFRLQYQRPSNFSQKLALLKVVGLGLRNPASTRNRFFGRRVPGNKKNQKIKKNIGLGLAPATPAPLAPTGTAPHDSCSG